MSGNHGGCCVIVCLNEIPLQETAMVKGCQHTYWYKTLGSSVGFLEIIVLYLRLVWFHFKVLLSSMNILIPVHIEDFFLFEESVCGLLRASWFIYHWI
ncbi:unnamed protein product [Brassica rapa]|uniref:Uncharacterized protein n=1 Tax=Brassica campestris TaxID=3711 RepID=A0A3P6D2E7_BRACM|nr:unnamed protein product [Brassica rapa]VDD18854.1 unnamed protein product [Brassica rapa]